MGSTRCLCEALSHTMPSAELIIHEHIVHPLLGMVFPPVCYVVHHPEIPILDILIAAISRMTSLLSNFHRDFDPDLVIVVVLDWWVVGRDTLDNQIAYVRNTHGLAQGISIPLQPLIADGLAVTCRQQYLPLVTCEIECAAIPKWLGQLLFDDKVIDTDNVGVT